MSKAGAPIVRLDDITDLRVGVVASTWHQEIMDGLIGGAQRACEETHSRVTLVRVPGSFELPLAAQKLAASHDAVVALGVVIRGGTPHFDYVCQGVTQGIMEVTLSTRTPIGFGLLTCDTEQDARDRAGLPGSTEDKGYEATSAALLTHRTLSKFR